VTLIEVVPATDDDLDGLVQLRLAEAWHANHWLMRAMQRWEGGRLLVLIRTETSPIATAASPALRSILAAVAVATYGPHGFIGNVIVNPDVRRQGYGRQVMAAALEWLHDQGVRVVELDATKEGQPLYERLGFVAAMPSWVVRTHLNAERVAHLLQFSSADEVVPLGASNLEEIAAIDRAGFGGRRLELLGHVLADADCRGFIAVDAQRSVTGYIIVHPLEAPRTGVRIGPWVAVSPAAATRLLAHVLTTQETAQWRLAREPTSILACVPGKSTSSLELARTHDLTLLKDDLRMELRWPSASAWAWTGAEHPDWVYAMLAPMVG
jgi:predicted GNAT family N-acyltransferase